MKTPRALLTLLSCAALCGSAMAQSSTPDYRLLSFKGQGFQATVHFEPGSSNLSLKDAQALQGIASQAKASGARVAGVLVIGHADRNGEWNSNDLLASERAVGVGALLADALDTTRVDARSMSDAQPALGCEAGTKKAKSSSCLAANRRATAVIVLEGARR